MLTGAQILKTMDASREEINEISAGGPKYLVVDYKGPKSIIDPANKDKAGLIFYRDEAYKPAVIDFYAGVCGSRIMAEIILSHADLYDIDASLAFSLAWKESNFQPDVTHTNSGGSVDRGLFQLNSKYFVFSSEREVFDVRKNANAGLKHLRYLLNEAGNKVAALAMYNAGKSRVSDGETPLRTLNYVHKILNYEEDLNNRLINYIERFLIDMRGMRGDIYYKTDLTQAGSLNSLYQ